MVRSAELLNGGVNNANNPGTDGNTTVWYAFWNYNKAAGTNDFGGGKSPNELRNGTTAERNAATYADKLFCVRLTLDPPGTTCDALGL